MLICQSTVPFVSGGAELHVARLAEAVAESGYQVDVMSLPYEWDPPQRVIKSCLLWRLVDLSDCPSGDIDMVLVTKFPTYALRHPNKVAWVFHQHRSLYDLKGTIYDDLTKYRGAEQLRNLLRRMDAKLLSECRKIFATSDTVAGRLREFCGVDSEVVYHPPPYHGKYYSGDYGDDVLVVGRLEPLKRVDLAISAMGFLANRDSTLRIVGRGFLEEPLRELAREQGIEGRVSFEGLVPAEELLSLYANAGCVVYVPFQEDYGYCTLEAYESRRPIVVTDDSGGPLEFVKDGVNGRIVPPEPRELAGAIDELLADKKKARRFGNSGFEAVEGISWTQVVQRIISPFVDYAGRG